MKTFTRSDKKLRLLLSFEDNKNRLHVIEFYRVESNIEYVPYTISILGGYFMPVTVGDILAVKSLESATTIAGRDGQKNTVSNVMIVEAPDVDQWINPHEILITSLFGFDKLDNNEINHFMETLHQYACSALIIKTSRFVAKIPQQIVNKCNEYSIPLIEIPRQTKYSDILLQIMQLLFNEKNLLLDQYKRINQKFVNMAIHGSSMQTIVNLLDTLINHTITIFQIKNQQEISVVSSRPSSRDFQRVQLKKRMSVVKKEYTNYQYFQAPLIDSSDYQLIVKIPQNNTDDFYLGVIVHDKPIRDIDFMAIENAVSFTQMESIKQAAVKQSMRAYANDIIDDLINGKISSQEQFNNTLSHFKLSATNAYRIIVIQASLKQQLASEYFSENPRIADHVITLFKRYWSETIYRIRQNRIILIIPNQPTAIKETKQTLSQIISTLQKDDPHCAFQIGISEPCHPIDFKTYAEQSLKTVQIASNLYKRSFIFSFNDLGFYRFLFNITDTAQLRSFIPEELVELHQNKPDLYKTLQVYLENNQNAKESASILFIHPKTMSYRLTKIKERMGINYEDVDEIFRVNVGIRILAILNNETIQGADPLGDI